MSVVIVESPAKAKTINKYLGSDYEVVASYGHVRDLPAKAGSVLPEEDFAMLWTIDVKSEKRMKDIAEAVRGAGHLYLATDPDREGEAIAWHIREVLRERGALENVEVHRVAFHEITKSAVLDAMQHPTRPRPQADRFVPCAARARLPSRVHPFAGALAQAPRQPLGRARAIRGAAPDLRAGSGDRNLQAPGILDDRGHLRDRCRRQDPGEADPIERREGREVQPRDGGRGEVRAGSPGTAGLCVERIERKQSRRHPPAPFTTSTLQQEASRKLGFSAKHTMSVAQRLYEGLDVGGDTGGLITYMRTDSVHIAKEAIAASRSTIASECGNPYLPKTPHAYRSHAKNAQEAHEAIRPTNFQRRPQDVVRSLNPDQAKLYELIWKRALASQMSSALLDNVAIDIAASDVKDTFRATGSVVTFDGFLKLYQEGRDEPSEDEEGKELPRVSEKDSMPRKQIQPEQHFTQPQPRFSEASLVKRLEELGIGRPSTYASIISVLQDRDYVRLEKKRFIPEDRGMLVTSFLANFFQRYIQYHFTADLEDRLDDISEGRTDWKQVLHDFWTKFETSIDNTKDLAIKDVLDALDKTLGAHFFPQTDPNVDPRRCPACDQGKLALKLGKFGAFVGCSAYPDCTYTRQLAEGLQENGGAVLEGPVELGQDPETGETVSLRKGPYGLYLQLGEVKEKGDKPKRVSLPADRSPQDLELDFALQLLRLPREVGKHPENGAPILAGIGQYGPYVQHEKNYHSLPTVDDVLTIGLNRAVDVLATPKKGRQTAAALRTLGDHPEDAKPITVHDGRYGPYVKHGGTNATIPKSSPPESITLEEALPLLAAREERKKKKKTLTSRSKTTKKKTTKKKAAKKKTVKKKTAADASASSA